jgi:Rubisco Assembly chaperone C-terminal domain/Rubisco accumulation factor 1 alpha helical domain/Rubisco accumulation factor 1 helix turn helix domain
MTITPQPPGDPIDTEALIIALRRKEGTWVEWGQACQKLQKSGLNPQQIFEDTGFEPTHQNQVIVAAQVYHGLEQANASANVLEHFQRRGSDILHEFRVLPQSDRIAAATLAVQHGVDVDDAREIAKALKDYSRLRQPPEGFTTDAGDGVAYQCWYWARQKSDLQERSRLIARGLKFAHSDSARKALEKLLTDFSVIKAKPAPLLPTYRLESEVELARVVPLIGQWPLPTEALTAVPFIAEEGPFRMIQFSGEGVWVPIPGWQVMLQAEDPIALLCPSDHLPIPQGQSVEEVLVVIDRAQRNWNENSYFVLDRAGQLDIQCSTEPTAEKILGRVLLVVRPKRILDENVTKELWLYDE